MPRKILVPHELMIDANWRLLIVVAAEKAHPNLCDFTKVLLEVKSKDAMP